MADLTNEEIAELRRLHDVATPAPWIGEWLLTSELGDPVAATDVSLAEGIDINGALIAAARNALPSLLDEVERLRNHIQSFDVEADIRINAARLSCEQLTQEVERLRAELERRERMDGEP